MSDPGKRKGTFDQGLPVSKGYIYPRSRRRMLVIGAFALAALGAYVILDYVALGKGFITAGPLSSAHANLDRDCGACHAPFRSAGSTRCAGCHEVKGSGGRAFSFSSHYLYRSLDVNRLKSPRVASVRSDEVECAKCHAEHNGRAMKPIEAADGLCLDCHSGYDFDKGHPQFAHAKPDAKDDDSIEFTHKVHVVDMIMFTDGLTDETLDRACTHCHELAADGMHFQPMTYEKNCGTGTCHPAKGSWRHKDLGQLRDSESECYWCHTVNGRNVAPVAADQRVMRDADFDHSAHLANASCLDCHNNIRMSESRPSAELADMSATQNLPSIDDCRQCHTSRSASSNCTTCHQFHPNKNLRFQFTSTN